MNSALKADIRLFDRVFEPEFASFLLANARLELSRGTGFTKSNLQWQEVVRRDSAVVLVRKFDEILSSLILDRLIARGMIEGREYKVMNFAWTRLSFIPWHNDGHHSEAITVYLNEQWELDWGGLFMWEDEERQIRAVPPNFNTGIRNRANINHSTTMVALDAPEPRFTLQLFAKLGSELEDQRQAP